MTDRIFFYGTISGLIAVSAIIAGIVSADGNPNASSHSLWFGYLVMFVALSMIFFAIKQHRDRTLGGVIKFLPAFMMGIGIAVIAGIIYMGAWEIYLAATNYAFMDQYTAAMLEAERVKGTPPDKIAAMAKEFESLKIQYQDPLFRMPLTFLEIFPVGLLVSLFSALILQFPEAFPARA